MIFLNYLVLNFLAVLRVPSSPLGLNEYCWVFIYLPLYLSIIYLHKNSLLPIGLLFVDFPLYIVELFSKLPCIILYYLCGISVLMQ